MFATTTLIKNSKFTGKVIGTHQQLDKSARQLLGFFLPREAFFPTTKEILHFEGTRGPDGLKRKSPGADDPSHMFDGKNGEVLIAQILDHYHNLITALKDHNPERAAFEAAWLAHKVTDALTPAHHFPLSDAKEELMTNKEMVKLFGEPIKGLMHGRNALETMRNNWLYWGAGGYMTKHIGYEYGVAMIAAALSEKHFLPKLKFKDFEIEDPKALIHQSIKHLQPAKIYQQFRSDGWTTELAFTTRDQLLPEIVKNIFLIWYWSAKSAYEFPALTPQAFHRFVSEIKRSYSHHPRHKQKRHKQILKLQK